MDSHLVTCKSENQSNRRNGNLKKTGTGSFELETPRDREGSFKPNLAQ